MRSFQLGRPGISAISFDGQQYPVSPDGLIALEPNQATPALVNKLKSHFAAREVDENDTAGPADEDERQILFARLDAVYGHPIDRRKSLNQLRRMLQLHEDRQRRTAGASTATHTGVQGEPEPDEAQGTDER